MALLVGLNGLGGVAGGICGGGTACGVGRGQRAIADGDWTGYMVVCCCCGGGGILLLLLLRLTLTPKLLLCGSWRMGELPGSIFSSIHLD